MSTKALYCKYRCFLHLMALKPRRNAHFCILFCNDAWKTLAGTKKNKAQSHKTLAGTKKKQTPSIYSGLWIPIDWKYLLFFAFFCEWLPRFCEIVLCFLFAFLVPVQVWWACFMLKRKEHIYSVLCSFHSKITSPWSPKEITGNCRKVVLRQVAVPIKSS